MATTATSLWRSVRKEQFPDGVVVNGYPADGILYPDFEARELPNGSTRAADVEIKKGQVQKWGGTSLFDKAKVFQGKSWLAFRIPNGTEIDPLLIVRHTNYNTRFAADHYQIEVAKPIPVKSYKGALDNFARAALAKAYQDAHR